MEKKCFIIYFFIYFCICNFTSNTLESAIKEINESTDILVSYETKKDGKKIIGITFSISKKLDAIPASITSSEEEVKNMK